MSDAHTGSKKLRSLGGFLGEVLMISIAVFLGLLADGWRESRQHREAALTALRNFRAEIAANGQSIDRVKQYHATLLQEITMFLASRAKPLEAAPDGVHFRGLQPIAFEHTAWDLALATQALSYVPADLGLSLSRIYTRQQKFETYENGFMQGAFAPVSLRPENRDALLTAMQSYLADVIIDEPALLTQYQTILPALDRALGGQSAAATPAAPSATSGR